MQRKRAADGTAVPAPKEPCIDLFDVLPVELIECILSHIDLACVPMIRATCHAFRRIIHQPRIITPIMQRALTANELKQVSFALVAFDQDERTEIMKHFSQFAMTSLVPLTERAFSLNVWDESCCIDKTDGLRILLDRGGSPNTCADAGLTPLCAAIGSGSFSAVSLLLSRGATVNGTPLLRAVCAEHVCIARMLLEYKANPNATGDDGNTMLMYATIGRNLQMMHLLVTHGARLDSVNVFGRTALEIACFGEGQTFNVYENYVPQTLEYVEDVVVYLINRGASVELGTHRDIDYLVCASSRGWCTMTDALLRRGIDPNKKDRIKRTALSASIIHGCGSTAEILLRHGASASNVDPRSRTPLMLAVRYGRPKVVYTLLQMTDPNTASAKNGKTALMYACESASDEIAGILIRHGVQLEKVDHGGRTALAWAATHGNATTLGMLIEYGAKVDIATAAGETPLMLLVKHNDESSMSMILDRGAPINAVAADGQTALMKAVRAQKRKTVAFLLAHGADPYIADVDGKTPFDYAPPKTTPKIARLLQPYAR